MRKPEVKHENNDVISEASVDPKQGQHYLVKLFKSFSDDHVAAIPALTIYHTRYTSEREKEEVHLVILDLFKKVKALHTLAIFLLGFQSVLPIATICRTGATLKKLRVVDITRCGTDPTSYDDLRELKEHCPLLEDLQINLPMFPYKDLKDFPDRLTFKAQESLELLSEFRNLVKLSLFCEQSLGTLDPMDSSSTDPDYDDAENIMETLHKNKCGNPFEKLSITLDRSFRPKNWRRPAGGGLNATRAKFHWSARRKFHCKLGDEGQYMSWVSEGSDRVEELPDESEEQRMKANTEWLKYHEAYGDRAPVREARNLYSIGWLHVDSDTHTNGYEKWKRGECKKGKALFTLNSGAKNRESKSEAFLVKLGIVRKKAKV
ncbi:hypothetical protein VTL71DRAFT_6898 [Oculimacula yallundae]|uniref:Uncharacterized protein n=1 Tax=Oculimacula yallundae TaxID=86028 RepID=A0ABR4BWC0_9HELO